MSPAEEDLPDQERPDAEVDAPDEQRPDAEVDGPDDAEDGPIEQGELIGALEAILFVIDTPLPIESIASALRVPTADARAAVAALGAAYDERGAGIEVRESESGVRIYTRPAYAAHVEQFLLDGQRTRLSQAALETLAVIAYRQPVTRSRVAAIRGVNVDGVVRTLLARGLIVEVGTEADSGAGLFRTTELFLERMGLESLDQLPSLAPLLPELSMLEDDEL